MANELSININIADRMYPLKVDINEEEIVRKAAKLINEKIVRYRQQYKNKDLQDFMAMSALEFAIKFLESDANKDIDPLLAEISKINKEVSDYNKGNF